MSWHLVLPPCGPGRETSPTHRLFPRIATGQSVRGCLSCLPIPALLERDPIPNRKGPRDTKETAARIMPAQLKELMRHESIETTLRYYVGSNAERTADACWEAFDRAASIAAPAPVVENGVLGACA